MDNLANFGKKSKRAKQSKYEFISENEKLVKKLFGIVYGNENQYDVDNYDKLKDCIRYDLTTKVKEIIKQDKLDVAKHLLFNLFSDINFSVDDFDGNKGKFNDFQKAKLKTAFNSVISENLKTQKVK